MWRIESELVSAGTPYDRRAALYDRLVRSRIYNRIAWSSAPGDYADFAAAAFGSSDGPLLEAAAGSAAATAALHGTTARPTVLVDLSRAMLERAAERIGGVGTNGEIPVRVRLVQADILALPMEFDGFTTILGLGLTHLFDDIPGLVGALQDRLAPGGRIYLAGLVAETRRGRHYLELLHRAGEVAVPRTANELRAMLGYPASFRVTGCMAYATLGA
ncbi:MAG: class I SAM-dependent methyltransferase [Candidatus Dormibacteraeota bacterium]|nr:class I SAM-dependent methyltransferase [Candidatus Dormibacteraeota bacterium]MDQ6909242.1 class I SAM-dependent methyltransferase [Actinomycetota bacterium]